MGAYLSEPKTDKVSTDESNDILTVGASSMQGWRNNQEVRDININTNKGFNLTKFIIIFFCNRMLIIPF